MYLTSMLLRLAAGSRDLLVDVVFGDTYSKPFIDRQQAHGGALAVLAAPISHRTVVIYSPGRIILP